VYQKSAMIKVWSKQHKKMFQKPKRTYKTLQNQGKELDGLSSLGS